MQERVFRLIEIVVPESHPRLFAIGLAVVFIATVALVLRIFSN